MFERASLSKTLKTILDFAFPPKCLLCGKIDENSLYPYLCSECYQGFKSISNARCTVCGVPFPSDHTADHICNECFCKRPYFDSAISAGIYEGKLECALRTYKYRKKRVLYRPISDFLKGGIERLGSVRFDVAVPVPLSRAKLRDREFDQAYLVAKRVADHMKIPLDFRSLVKTRDTAPQVELDYKSRKNNLKGCFALAEKSAFEDKNVLLVDDVYTSGSTLNECSKVLKKQGRAKSVHCLTVARTYRG